MTTRRTALRPLTGGTLLLAGCATSVNTLSQAELNALKLESVEVVYKGENVIWWGNAEREYAAKAANDPAVTKAKAPGKAKAGEADDSADLHARLIESPEAKAYVRNRLTTAITERLTRIGQAHMHGTRPAKIVVEVHAFTIPSAAQRVVLGGAPQMLAVTLLKDARTGAELAKLDRATGAVAGNGILGVLVDQAFDDLDVRLLDAYADQVRQWLAVQTRA
jgi:hypothetical protein